MAKHIAIWKVKESLAESIVKDFVTLITVGFLIYLSQGSTWWTFVTGGIFILLISFHVNKIISKSENKFSTTDQVRAWLDRIDAEDGK